MVGQTLGHYRILDKLGEGGMGEVYRAHDEVLGRDVAIKVLPELFLSDAERLLRFEREAKLLATLNHPNIAQIHSLEEAEGQKLLVMELVEGDTLADRLAARQHSVPDAIEIAIQISRALEAAHERGIVHRDLKPANIKITPDGEVKVLDFGLAKPVGGAPSSDFTHSPTLTYSPTEAGILLGTAAYMSPEQTRGQEVDKRTDIWAFGVVLWEILAGAQMFSGGTVSDILAAVLRAEMDWEALPAETPSNVRRLLQRCLTRDRRDRLHDIADARIELEEAIREPTREPDSGIRSSPEPVSTAQVSRPRSFWTAAIVGGLIVVVLAIWWVTRPQPQALRASRFDLQAPPNVVLAVEGAAHKLAISPDGRQVVFRGQADDGDSPPQLYLRSLDNLETVALSGTIGGLSPFFSPDSRWLGFWSDGMMRKIDLSGGEPQAICETSSFRGASWTEDGTIIFGTVEEGLYQVPAAGGTASILTEPDPEADEVGHRWPQDVPGARAVLFEIRSGPFESRNRIAALSLDTGEYRVVRSGGNRPFFAPTGHLIYSVFGVIYAAEFDVQSLEVAGEPRAVLQDVRYSSASGDVRLAVSTEGSMVYVPGAWKVPESELIWIDRDGDIRPALESRRAFASPKISPDGRYLAVSIQESAESGDIWLCELERLTWSRVTFEGAYEPLWSPDGQSIVFSSTQNISYDLYRLRIDGSGPAEQLTSGTSFDFAGSFSPDGQVLLFQRQIDANVHLFALDLRRQDEPAYRLSETPIFEAFPALSPDGQWLAFLSEASGRPEIYVKPFPGPGARTQISMGGGTDPVWHPSGRELFYRETRTSQSGGRKIWSVTLSLDPEVSAQTPQLVVETEFDIFPQAGWHSYDVSPDGEKLVAIRPLDAEPDPTRLVYVPQWTSELQQLLRAGD